MTRNRKLMLVAAGAAGALLVVGLGAAGAVAASKIFSPSEESKAIIDDAASQLGVQPDALSDALKQALENRIDEAVEAGRLTKEQGQELKDRIDSNDYPFLFGPGLGPHTFGFGFPGRFDFLETAASYLGMSEEELRDALQDKTLAEIAKDKGKSVSGLVQALVAAQEKRIDVAVADGRLTQDQAAELKANLKDKIEALVNGELRTHKFEWGDRFWHGSGPARAPPLFRGPTA